MSISVLPSPRAEGKANCSVWWSKAFSKCKLILYPLESMTKLIRGPVAESNRISLSIISSLHPVDEHRQLPQHLHIMYTNPTLEDGPVAPYPLPPPRSSELCWTQHLSQSSTWWGEMFVFTQSDWNVCKHTDSFHSLLLHSVHWISTVEV